MKNKKVSINPQVFESKMKGFNEFDTEMAHVYADELMCQVLTDLGYGEGIEVFKNMTKWYS